MQGRPKLALRPCPHGFGEELEVDLSTELHRAWRMSACSLSKGAVSKTGINDPKVGVIEEVESLCPHLKIDTFGEPEVLQQAQIDLFHTRAQDVSNGATAKVSLGRSEGAGCEPLGLSLGQVNCRHLIGARRDICVWIYHAQTA